MKLTDTVQNEYWFHVADQVDIPIAGEVDKSIDVEELQRIAKDLPNTEHEAADYIVKLVAASPDAIDILRTLIGVSDKRMYLELSYLFSKERYSAKDKENVLGYSVYDLQKKPLKFFKGLLVSDDKLLASTSHRILANYFLSRGIFKVLRAIAKVDKDELGVLVEKLIITKEVQQAEAKRRGHGAEHQLACLINELGLEMIPDGRHSKPMGFRDPNVDRDTFEVRNKEKGKTWSFDLIVRNTKGGNCAFVQSLIHTSDPGQYGVNKSDETTLIKNDLIAHNAKYNTSKELWGIVDGVGFCENKKDTIDKMLTEFDCFVQMKTLYKAGLRMHQRGETKIKAISFNPDFYSEEEQVCMYEKYARSDIEMIEIQNASSSWVAVPAGMATLFI